MNAEIAIGISLLTGIGVIIGIVSNMNAIGKDREKRGREMGEICSDIKSNREAISRAFDELTEHWKVIDPMRMSLMRIEDGVKQICESLDSVVKKLEKHIEKDLESNK